MDVEHARPYFCLAPTKSKRRRPGKAIHVIDYDPRNLPDTYAVRADGDCMEPEIADGTMLLFSKTERPVPGDLVGFFLRRSVVLPGGHQMRVKRLTSAIPADVTFPYTDPPGDVFRIITFEMNNPRKTLYVRCCDLLAVHKCLGNAVPGTTHRATARQRTDLYISRGMPAI